MENFTEKISIISNKKVVYAQSNFDTQYFPMTDILLISNSVVGIIANLVSMFILSSSRRINSSSSYMLLMNQSVVDAIASCAMFCFGLTRNLIHRRNLNGFLDQLYCHLIFSGVLIVGTNCVSSINLSVLALERMSCIVFPIQHRMHCTRRLGKQLSVFTWIIGTSAMIPLSIVANGINEHLSGMCYFWDRLDSGLSSKIFSFTFEIITFGIPVMVMIFSFAGIYLKLRTHAIKESVKLNVVKMLSTCVFLFLLCNMPKAICSLISRFSSHNLFRHHLYPYAVLLLMSNSVVNPFIYSLQYSDYRKELKRQFYRFTANKEKFNSIESLGTISSSIKESSNL